MRERIPSRNLCRELGRAHPGPRPRRPGETGSLPAPTELAR